MKKLLGLLLILALAFSMTAVAEGKTYKIGYAISSLANESFINQVDAMEAHAKELGNVELVVVSSDNDPAQAISDIENFLSGEYDAIIVQNYSEGAFDEVVGQALAQGIPTVYFDGNLTDKAAACYCANNYDLGYEIGRAAAEWINEKFGGKATIGMFNRDDLSYLKERGEGLRTALKDLCPDSEIVMDATFLASEGADGAENFLQVYPDLNCLVCLYDGIAVNAYPVFKQYAQTNGWDVSEHGIFASDAGTLALEYMSETEDSMYRGTIDLNLSAIGCQMIDDLVTLLEGGELESDVIYFPLTHVNASNVADYIDG